MTNNHKFYVYSMLKFGKCLTLWFGHSLNMPLSFEYWDTVISELCELVGLQEVKLSVGTEGIHLKWFVVALMGACHEKSKSTFSPIALAACLTMHSPHHVEGCTYPTASATGTLPGLVL